MLAIIENIPIKGKFCKYIYKEKIIIFKIKKGPTMRQYST
jgi:hypothetical protein